MTPAIASELRAALAAAREAHDLATQAIQASGGDAGAPPALCAARSQARYAALHVERVLAALDQPR